MFRGKKGLMSPPRPAAPRRRAPPINAPFQPFHPRSEPFDDVTNMPHLVELGLQLVDLPDYLPEACDFGIGRSDGGGGARRLVRGGALSLSCELDDLFSWVVQGRKGVIGIGAKEGGNRRWEERAIKYKLYQNEEINKKGSHYPPSPE